MYSHHQKSVVVDQLTGYVGGIDLAMGRYDTDERRLWDIAGDEFCGIDYYNPCIREHTDKNLANALLRRI